MGDFSRPLISDWGKGLPDPLLREDLVRCVAGDPANRFPSAAELSANLRALEQRRKAIKEFKAAMSALDEEQTARRASNKAERKLILIRLPALASMVFMMGVMGGIAVAFAVGMNTFRFQERMGAEALFVSNLNLASQAIDMNELDRVRNLLKSGFRYVFRENLPASFELRYLWARCQTGSTPNDVEARFNAVYPPLLLVGNTHLLMRTGDGSTLDCWSLTNSRVAWASRLPVRTVPPGAVSISPNGESIALASTNGDVEIWNVSESKLMATFRGHAKEVHLLAFSPNGLWLLTGSQGDHSLRLWNLAKGIETSLTTNFVGVASFSPDGRTVAYCSSRGMVNVWDVAARRDSRTISYKTNVPSAMALSYGGRFLATGHHDGSLEISELGAPRHRSILEAHKAALTCLAFSPDGQSLATSSLDRTVKFWKVGGDSALLRGAEFVTVLAGKPMTSHYWGPLPGVELVTLKGWSEPI